jgi:hypothetical protein
MSTGTVVHEKMHQRTREDEQEGPPAVQMCPVLGHQIKPADDQKANQYKVGTRDGEAARLAIMISMFHLDLRSRRATNVVSPDYAPVKKHS